MKFAVVEASLLAWNNRYWISSGSSSTTDKDCGLRDVAFSSLFFPHNEEENICVPLALNRSAPSWIPPNQRLTQTKMFLTSCPKINNPRCQYKDLRSPNVYDVVPWCLEDVAFLIRQLMLSCCHYQFLCDFVKNVLHETTTQCWPTLALLIWEWGKDVSDLGEYGHSSHIATQTCYDQWRGIRWRQNSEKKMVFEFF